MSFLRYKPPVGLANFLLRAKIWVTSPLQAPPPTVTHSLALSRWLTMVASVLCSYLCLQIFIFSWAISSTSVNIFKINAVHYTLINQFIAVHSIKLCFYTTFCYLYVHFTYLKLCNTKILQSFFFFSFCPNWLDVWVTWVMSSVMEWIKLKGQGTTVCNTLAFEFNPIQAGMPQPTKWKTQKCL